MSDASQNPENHIALFQRKEVRRTIHNNEWWFVISDVVAALTDSVDPQGYIKDMRRRDPEISKGWGQIATPLSIATPGGPQNLNCANAEGLSGSSSLFLAPRPSPSSDGWPRSATNESRRSKIQNWPSNAAVRFTKPRATATIGSKSACAPSPSAMS